jgi:ankyrin repeat protein
MTKLGGELFRAVESGNVASAERSIRRGADPNAREGRDVPPLFHAALRADADMVSALIRMGADPHAQEPGFGRNALGYLLHHRRLGISPERVAATARLLIAQGLKPDHRPRPGYVSPWWQALGDHRCTAVVQAMLESGVDPNLPLRAESNYTPLMEAATNRCVETVKLLLAAGAEPGATTTAGATAARMIEEPNKNDPEWDNWSTELTAELLRLLRA